MTECIVPALCEDKCVDARHEVLYYFRIEALARGWINLGVLTIVVFGNKRTCWAEERQVSIESSGSYDTYVRVRISSISDATNIH